MTLILSQEAQEALNFILLQPHLSPGKICGGFWFVLPAVRLPHQLSLEHTLLVDTQTFPFPKAPEPLKRCQNDLHGTSIGFLSAPLLCSALHLEKTVVMPGPPVFVRTSENSAGSVILMTRSLPKQGLPRCLLYLLRFPSRDVTLQPYEGEASTTTMLQYLNYPHDGPPPPPPP